MVMVFFAVDLTFPIPLDWK
jgi:hypothetical protein